VEWRISLAVLMALLAAAPVSVIAGGPRVSLATAEHDLGEVLYGHTKSFTVVVSNKGDQPLEIKGLRTSCGCTRVDTSKRSILPGDQALLTISFNATGIAPGRITKTVFIDTNDPAQSVSEFRFFALVVQQIRVEPSSLVARLPNFQEKLKFPMSVYNASDMPISIRVSEIRGSVVSAVQSPEYLRVDPQSKADFSLEIFLAGQESQRLYRGAVVVRTDHPVENPVVINVFITFDKVD